MKQTTKMNAVKRVLLDYVRASRTWQSTSSSSAAASSSTGTPMDVDALWSKGKGKGKKPKGKGKSKGKSKQPGEWKEYDNNKSSSSSSSMQRFAGKCHYCGKECHRKSALKNVKALEESTEEPENETATDAAMLDLIHLLEVNDVIVTTDVNDIFLIDSCAGVTCCPLNFAPHTPVRPGPVRCARSATGHLVKSVGVKDVILKVGDTTHVPAHGGRGHPHADHLSSRPRAG